MPRHLISDAHEWINEIPTVYSLYALNILKLSILSMYTEYFGICDTLYMHCIFWNQVYFVCILNILGLVILFICTAYFGIQYTRYMHWIYILGLGIHLSIMHIFGSSILVMCTDIMKLSILFMYTAYFGIQYTRYMHWMLWDWACMLDEDSLM